MYMCSNVQATVITRERLGDASCRVCDIGHTPSDLPLARLLKAALMSLQPSAPFVGGGPAPASYRPHQPTTLASPRSANQHSVPLSTMRQITGEASAQNARAMAVPGVQTQYPSPTSPQPHHGGLVTYSRAPPAQAKPPSHHRGMVGSSTATSLDLKLDPVSMMMKPSPAPGVSDFRFF
jgi:hypothetical protein